jgi:hypothetical protein
MTNVCHFVPASAKDPCKYFEFFSKAEDSIIDELQNRELPPITNPAASCDFNLFFGFFFDGTRNNYNLCAQNEAYSNVARLYDCYPGQVVPGVIKGDQSWPDYPHFFKVYVPGVGTPFPEVQDTNDSVWGAAAAKYGHERIVWGLMQAVNNIHRYFLNQALYNDAKIREISRQLTLTGWELKRGRYLSPEALQQGQQDSLRVLEGVLGELHRAIKPFMCPHGGRPAHEGKGKVGRIYVSAFGFSRGATKARVFINWLRKLCALDAQMLGCSSEFTLAGFPVDFDFLGIFDTVASVGLASSTLFWDGHGSWADAEISLRVPPGVKCLHLVAGHEIRRSFPLDSIQVGTSLDGLCEEIMFPGVHSDVGGGYGPREQGRGTEAKGVDLLSRIPLGVMYRKARLAGVPLKAEKMDEAIQYRMEADPDVIEHFNAYLDTLPRQQGDYRTLMLDMYLPYLRWRLSWADCNTREKLKARFANLQAADTLDVNDLLSANLSFIEHLGHYRRWAQENQTPPPPHFSMEPGPRAYYPPTFDADMVRNWQRLQELLPELQDAQWVGRAPDARTLPPAAQEMFQHLVHDSYAGFHPLGKEGAEILAELEKMSRQSPEQLSPTEAEWVGLYLRTKSSGRPQGPEADSKGLEPFWLGGGYLHIRRIYAGSDNQHLARRKPAPQQASQQAATTRRTRWV